jgi:DNA-directed RNA polymerase subunit RPC12/RpoP
VGTFTAKEETSMKNEEKVIVLRCPYCGGRDIATGPDWIAQSTQDGQQDGLVEHICRKCHRSFWI